MTKECLICRRNPDTGLTLITDTIREPKVWACDDHANIAIQRVANAYGFHAVREKLRKYIKATADGS